MDGRMVVYNCQVLPLDSTTSSMDPPVFVNHYRGLFLWLRSCGLPTPWLEKSHVFSKVLYLLYDVFVAAMVTYTISCYVLTIMTTSTTFQDLCSLGISSGCYICGLVLTFYLIQQRTSLKKITEAMDSIARSIMESDLAGKEYLQQEYSRNTRVMALLTNTSLILSFATPFFYVLSVPVEEWISGRYRDSKAIPMTNYFDDTVPVLYELTVLDTACSIAISTAKKSANDCLFISLFRIQTIFLKYLSVSKGVLQKELAVGITAHCRRKLLMWTKLHQEVNKNIQELILMFSPVVIIYYVLVIEIVVCGSFVELKKDNDTIVQSMSIGSYVASTILYYFLLANTADELTYQAQKLAFAEYSLPWYDMKRNDVKMIQLIQTMCSRPVEITAYRAPRFLLNRETFAGFMVAAISAFVTFCQISMVEEKVPSDNGVLIN